MRDPAIKAFRLTKDNVARVIRATKAMRSMAKTDAEFRREYSSQESVTANLDQTIADIEKKRPRHVAVIREVGLTPRDYILTFLALLQADAVSRNVEGASADYVNPENLMFVRRQKRQTLTAIREITKLNQFKERQSPAGVP